MDLPRIFNYQLTRTIGEGAFGQVFEAEHVILGRKTALKRLKPIGTEEDMDRTVGRFIREARILSRLNDDHIVQIYDIFMEPESGVWIAMEYVNGVDLAKLILSDSWSISDTAQLFYEMVEGVQTMHAHDIVHRDLKPQNFLVDLQNMNVKVSDFGLAFGNTEPDLMSSFNDISGTLPFMPPEQFEAAPLDHRADIWSMGVILYYLITRRLPFESETQMQLIKRIMTADYLTLETSEYPKWACEIIANSLRNDPSERFSSCREILTRIPITHGNNYKATRDLNREELLNAILSVMPERGVAIDRETAIKEASKTLGIKRVGKSIRFEFLSALRRGVKRGLVQRVTEDTIGKL